MDESVYISGIFLFASCSTMSQTELDAVVRIEQISGAYAYMVKVMKMVFTPNDGVLNTNVVECAACKKEISPQGAELALLTGRAVKDLEEQKNNFPWQKLGLALVDNGTVEQSALFVLRVVSEFGHGCCRCKKASWELLQQKANKKYQNQSQKNPHSVNKKLPSTAISFIALRVRGFASRSTNEGSAPCMACLPMAHIISTVKPSGTARSARAFS